MTSRTPLAPHLAEPTRLGDEISITGKWVPRRPGGRFRTSEETRQMLQEWQDIHRGARADAGVRWSHVRRRRIDAVVDDSGGLGRSWLCTRARDSPQRTPWVTTRQRGMTGSDCRSRMRPMSETIWDRLQECVGQLREPFRASEMVGWFRRHYPDVKEESLRAHIQGATSNASVESRGQFANRRPLITRVSRGVYRRYNGRPGGAYEEKLLRSDVSAVKRLRDLDLDHAVGRYLSARDPNARYASLTIATTTSSSIGQQSSRGQTRSGWRPAASSSASISRAGGCCVDQLSCCSAARDTWYRSSAHR